MQLFFGSAENVVWIVLQINKQDGYFEVWKLS